MREIITILFGSILIENVLLVKFLGLCPFLGVSHDRRSAIGMSVATVFVMTLSSGLVAVLDQYVLRPLELVNFRTFVFILVIAAVVQFTELMLKSISPVLHRLMGIYLPLITTNCAILGVSLLSVERQHNLIQGLFFAFGSGVGFALLLLLFTEIRHRLVHADIPNAFQGLPIALVTIGIMGLAFLGCTA